MRSLRFVSSLRKVTLSIVYSSRGQLLTMCNNTITVITPRKLLTLCSIVESFCIMQVDTLRINVRNKNVAKKTQKRHIFVTLLTHLTPILETVEKS